jgi:hypothetical protein
MSELSPSHFVEAALGFQKTAAIKAALALDLFTAIASEEGDIDKTAKRVQARRPHGSRRQDAHGVGRHPVNPLALTDLGLGSRY